MELIAGFEYMDSKAWADPMCNAIGGIMMDQFNNFGMSDIAFGVQFAKPSCDCLMANIHNLVNNGFQPASIANLGACANTISTFVNMAMSGSMDMNMDMGGHSDMDGHNNVDMTEWYSEANVGAALQVHIYLIFRLLNFY